MMNLKYSIKLLKNLQSFNEFTLCYLQVQGRERINTYHIARGIEYTISLTIVHILNLLQVMIVKIKDNLTDRDNVNVGKFLKFQYQICGKESLMSEKFNNTTNIQEVKLQMKPVKYMRKSMETLDYKSVNPVNVKQQILCKEEENLKSDDS